MPSELLCPLLAMGQDDHRDIDDLAGLRCRFELCAWWCDHDGDGMCSMLHVATVHSGYIEALGDEVTRVGLAIRELTKAVEKTAKKERADG
jgi:hypothetical protein